METETDPLRALVIDAAQVNRQLLADLLRGRVWLDPSARRFVFEQGLRQCTTLQQRILLALIARKALSLLMENEDDVQDRLTPKELETTLGEKGGSIRSAVKRLADDGLIFSSGGGYTVPAHVLDRLNPILSTGE